MLQPQRLYLLTSIPENSVSGCDLSVAAHASRCKGDWAGCVRMGWVCGISGDLVAIVSIVAYICILLLTVLGLGYLYLVCRNMMLCIEYVT